MAKVIKKKDIKNSEKDTLLLKIMFNSHVQMVFHTMNDLSGRQGYS